MRVCVSTYLWSDWVFNSDDSQAGELRDGSVFVLPVRLVAVKELNVRLFPTLFTDSTRKQQSSTESYPYRETGRERHIDTEILCIMHTERETNRDKESDRERDTDTETEREREFLVIKHLFCNRRTGKSRDR